MGVFVRDALVVCTAKRKALFNLPRPLVKKGQKSRRKPDHPIMPHPTQLIASEAALLVIDVQEKLMVKIPGEAHLIRNIAFLIDGSRLLDVPVTATEQYPKGLGPTVPELARRLPERPDKVAFSSCAVPEVVEHFRRAARPKVVLAGIETHVCVLHTALDLLALDFRVYVAVDAVGS